MYVRAACTSIRLLMPRAWSWNRSDMCQVCSKTQANLDSKPPREYGCALSNRYSSLDLWKNVSPEPFHVLPYSDVTLEQRPPRKNYGWLARLLQGHVSQPVFLNVPDIFCGWNWHSKLKLEYLVPEFKIITWHRVRARNACKSAFKASV